jgi:hypothetical protein
MVTIVCYMCGLVSMRAVAVLLPALFCSFEI